MRQPQFPTTSQLPMIETRIDHIEKHKLMVAIRTATPDIAYKAALACIRGGARLVEITFSVPGAEEVIRQLNTETDALIGAGTVLNIKDLHKAIKAGAAYIVSPNFDEKIVKATKKAGAISIPGASTPTEIYRAHQAGGDIIKLFPFVEMGGLNFLSAIRGPMPFIRFMLCGGVSQDNISEYLAARPSCILVGSSVLRKDLVTAERWDIISKRTKILVDMSTSQASRR